MYERYTQSMHLTFSAGVWIIIILLLYWSISKWARYFNIHKIIHVEHYACNTTTAEMHFGPRMGERLQQKWLWEKKRRTTKTLWFSRVFCKCTMDDRFLVDLCNCRYQFFKCSNLRVTKSNKIAEIWWIRIHKICPVLNIYKIINLNDLWFMWIASHFDLIFPLCIAHCTFVCSLFLFKISRSNHF